MRFSGREFDSGRFNPRQCPRRHENACRSGAAALSAVVRPFCLPSPFGAKTALVLRRASAIASIACLKDSLISSIWSGYEYAARRHAAYSFQLIFKQMDKGGDRG